MSASQGTPPLSETRFKQIVDDACNAALSKAERYDHPQMESWNSTIINKTLHALISEATPKPDDGKPAPQCPWKFAINSTVIQHLEDPVPTGTDGGSGADRPKARRGMHSAAGAYWNNEKDGMWSHKWEGGEAKGMDVVVLVVWIAA